MVPSRARIVLLAFIVTAACTRAKKDVATDAKPIPLGAPLSQDEPDASDAQAAPRAIPVPSVRSIAELCGDIVEDDRDAGAPAPPPSATASAAARRGPTVDVRFRTTVTRGTQGASGSSIGVGDMGEMAAFVTAPSLGFDRQVFHVPVVDPHQCCGRVRDGRLVFHCWFSGIDAIEGGGSARREGDAVVVRWCISDLSTSSVLDKGEVRLPLKGGADARFIGPSPECSPPKVP